MKISAWVEANSDEDFEIPDNEVKGLDPDKLANYILENYVRHWADERTHCGFNVIEPPKDTP